MGHRQCKHKQQIHREFVGLITGICVTSFRQVKSYQHKTWRMFRNIWDYPFVGPTSPSSFKKIYLNTTKHQHNSNKIMQIHFAYRLCHIRRRNTIALSLNRLRKLALVSLFLFISLFPFFFILHKIHMQTK